MIENFIQTQNELERLLGPGSIGDISLPTGWIGLLEAFTIYLKSMPPEIRSGISIHQIKEKHGTLRIYCYAPDEVFDLVGAAELASNAICGICGDLGCMRGTGWRGARCSLHAHGQRAVIRRVAITKHQLRIALDMLSDVFGRKFSKQELQAFGRLNISTARLP